MSNVLDLLLVIQLYLRNFTSPITMKTFLCNNFRIFLLLPSTTKKRNDIISQGIWEPIPSPNSSIYIILVIIFESNK